MRVFIAGPLFSRAEREFNLKVDAYLRKHGFETFLPQREVGKLWKPTRRKGRKASRMIYEMDLRGIEKADAVVAILDGPDVDSGTAFEIGYACARGKPVIGIKTDVRMFARNEEVNLMLAQGMRALVKDQAALLKELKNALGC